MQERGELGFVLMLVLGFAISVVAGIAIVSFGEWVWLTSGFSLFEKTLLTVLVLGFVADVVGR